LGVPGETTPSPSPEGGFSGVEERLPAFGCRQTKIGRITKMAAAGFDALGHCLRIALVLIVPLVPIKASQLASTRLMKYFRCSAVRAGYPFAEWFQHCAHFDEPPCSLLAFVGLGSR
jgi:hypothetical protein